jgi:Bacterial extracellular solute-binding protein, family 7
MKTRTIILLLTLAAFAASLGGCAATAPSPSSGEKTVIRLASPFKPGHTLVDTGNAFKQILEKESGGRLTVDVQAGVGSEEEINVWCSQGKVEMQATGGQPLEISAPQYFFLNAPFVMKDFEHFMRVWQGPLGKQARELVEKNGNQTYLEKAALHAGRFLPAEAAPAHGQNLDRGLEGGRHRPGPGPAAGALRVAEGRQGAGVGRGFAPDRLVQAG